MGVGLDLEDFEDLEDAEGAGDAADEDDDDDGGLPALEEDLDLYTEATDELA